MQALATDTAADPRDSLTALLKAAADPLRLTVLRLLADNSYGVLELAHLLAVRQSALSHHLKVLAQAGLVARRREGNAIYYRRAPVALDDRWALLQRSLFDSADQLPIDAELRERIATVQRERAEAQRAFFAEHADDLLEHQDLIAAFPQYGDTAAQLLAATAVPDTALAVEIGPGEGTFLPALAARFDAVVAVDISAQMLARARAALTAEGVDNIDWVHGDTGDAQRWAGQADCVVANMVLHHTPAPAAVITDLAALLKPGGALLITDLCRHEQSWVRESCGDLWQGFAPEEVSQWAEAAGLVEGQSQYLALRNGFRVQVREFLRPLAPERELTNQLRTLR